MTYDLDGADLAEVRRRVVNPVLAALLVESEVDGVRVQVGHPDDWSEGAVEPDDAPYVWVVVSADGDTFAWTVAKLIFERVDAKTFRDDFYAALQDWICCDTSFGGGQWREGVVEELPPAKAGSSPPSLRRTPRVLPRGGCAVAALGARRQRADR